jgi:hypothetical protein
MNTYIGTKVIRAIAMTRLAYNALRGWTVPADENGADEGYLVEYLDGGKPNVPGYTGYVSWSPKEQFDKAYVNVDNLGYGMALEALKRGHRIARAGWNGSGQWVTLAGPVKGSKVGADGFWSKNNADFARDQPNSEVTVMPCFTIKNAQDEIAVWVPSTSDCLAQDWRVLA